MIVYRVTKTKYAADLHGEGARLNGGRWNHQMVSCLYTSESRALALLEYTVNVNIDDIPRSLSLVSIEVPDNRIRLVKEAELPGNWKHYPAPSSTRDFGTQILLAAAEPIIKIPSAVISHEFNYLLNPLHPDSKKFLIVHTEDLVYDVRIKKL